MLPLTLSADSAPLSAVERNALSIKAYSKIKRQVINGQVILIAFTVCANNDFFGGEINF